MKSDDPHPLKEKQGAREYTTLQACKAAVLHLYNRWFKGIIIFDLLEREQMVSALGQPCIPVHERTSAVSLALAPLAVLIILFHLFCFILCSLFLLQCFPHFFSSFHSADIIYILMEIPLGSVVTGT